MNYFLHLVLLLGLYASAQGQNSVSYQYDANGNRIQRSFVGLRISPSSNSDSSLVPASEQLALKYGLSIFPNPSTDIVHVVLNPALESIPSDAVLRLMDCNGKQLAETKSKSPQTDLDLSGLAAGVYLLSIRFSQQEEAAYTVVKTN